MATLFNSALPFPRNISPRTSCSSSTIKTLPDAHYLERCGVSFTGIGDGCVLKMELENGTAAKLMLPTGLVTSFKPQMWHGGTVELLQTSVSQSENGAALIRGGLSLALALACQNDAGFSWSPHAWDLHQVTGTPQESIRVELTSTSEQGINVGIKHIITLEQDSFNSEIIVSNSTTSSIRLAGSTLCHLAVSTPDAAYAIGLQGSDYFVRPPFQGNFSIIPPRTDQNPNKFWPFNKLFAKEDDNINGQVESGEEDDDYKHLSETLSRIYTSTPRSFSIMDRGRRNSVTMRRQGFEEVYLMSPGSEHEWYSKYSYICIGHAAQLQPVIIDAQSEWSGGVQLINPNY